MDSQVNQPILTRREREILFLVKEGLATKQIASKLNLAEATVETYIKRARLKLGAPNRLTAVITAVENGLL